MNTNDFNKEMHNLVQNSIDNTMDMLSMMQNQNEKVLKLVTDQTLTAQTEGKKIVNEWMNKGKEANKLYRKTLENNMNNIFKTSPNK